MNRREKEKRKQRREASRQRYEESKSDQKKLASFRPKLDGELRYAKETIKPGTKVIPCARVSGRTQNKNGNLRNSIQFLKEKAKELGGIIVGRPIKKVGSGFDTKWLKSAFRKAKKLGAVLLFESSDRVLRNTEYNSNTNPYIWPTKRQWKGLREEADGVPIVTILHPNSSFEEIRRHQTKRGQFYKGSKGGRPSRWNTKMRLQAVELREDGMSLGKIALKLGISKPTIQGWVRNIVLSTLEIV